MKCSLARAFSGPFKAAFRGNVKFAADNGLDPSLLRLNVKFQRAEHGAVIRDRNRIHAVFLTFLHKVVQTDGAVQQAVLRVDVQMDKIGGC